MDGAVLEAGDELTEGSVNPHDILKIKGVRAVQDYMLREVQRVYRLQGVEINDKHIVAKEALVIPSNTCFPSAISFPSLSSSSFVSSKSKST